MTTLQPRPPYSAQELAQLYPQTLELQQVQVLLRHGERTPVNSRFQNAGLSPWWSYCNHAKEVRSIVLEADGSWDSLKWRRRLETFGSNDAPTNSSGPNGEQDAICKPGELTDRGRETTLALGQRIRTLYVDQLAFLPPFMNDEARYFIKLRATPIQRALESVQQAFVGLYPAGQRAPGLLPPSIIQRLSQDEQLVPNEGQCKRFMELSNAFANRVAHVWNDSPEMRYLNKKLGKWMPKDTPVIKVDGHPRLSGILDTVNATRAHGPATKLPSEFYDPQVIAHTDRICTEEWFIGYQESAEYRKLGIGSLIGDLSQNMVERVRGSTNNSEHETLPPFKISLAGCHDTTIASVLAALGTYRVDRDPWPRFTSSIAFELFRAKTPASSAPATTSGTVWPSKEKTWWFSLFSPSKSSLPSHPRQPLDAMTDGEKQSLDHYFVRMRYNDVPMVLPFCKPAGKHYDGDESLCTLAAFKQVADSMTPKDWHAECKANLGKPAFPEKIEPPPGVLIDKS